MSSIQERLQLKRVPLDSWNIREQLCLASAVVRSGDQNWMSVSRALKTVGDTNRPPDWYSQKSCAAQYGALLEHVETPKRKKRSSEGAGETPQESIVKRLTQDRIAEIQKAVAELTQQHDTIKNEINEVLNTSTSEDRLREIWSNIEANKRARERESARRAAWLKEREERRARAARNGRGSVSNAPPSPGAATPAPPSSPLLTSLLKSSPVVTTPQHIPHPATVVDTISPSVTAPTLSMLLEKNSPQQDSKRAAIEHIKSQLVQIEQQLKANTTPPPAPIAPAVDIDDIEIKAEDVYVFRDIDLNIPQVNSTEKAAEKPEKKEEDEQVEIEVETVTATEDVETDDKEEEVNIEVTEEIPIEVETEPQQEAEVKTEEEETPEEMREDEDIKISFPEVKFPTPEIKVIEPDEQKIKEEVKDPQPIKEEIQQKVEEEIVVQENESVEEVVEEVSIEEEPPPQPEPPAEPELVAQHEAIETKDIPLPPEPAPEPVVLVPEPPLPPEPEVEVKEEPEAEPEIVVQTQEVEPVTTPSVVEKSEDDIKREEDAEDSIPLKQMLRDESLGTIKEERIIEDAHTETDDDTPMELSREEEKDGKKKRDYSRKKKPDSRTCSGSESAPESPSSSDTDRQHRLWKKSVMLVYSRLCAHKYASLFLRPISDEEAPGYSAVVKRPMDLTTIRKNIENGVIRTTAEFQRDVLLMLSNALFYNSSEHSVYSMAKELHEEAACQLGMLLAAQAHAGLCAPPHARKRRRLHGKRTA